MVRRICAVFFLLCASLVGVSQTVSVTGVGIQNGSGSLLVSGTWCFGSQCLTVSQGSFSGSVTPGTQAVTVVNASSVTILTIPAVYIPSGTAFRWNSLVLPPNTLATGVGAPYLPCWVGASYTNTSTSATLYCSSYTGQMSWSSTQTAAASGIFSGFGFPTYLCTAPCVFTSIDLQKSYFTVAPTGYATSTWIGYGNGTVTTTGSPLSGYIAFFSSSTGITGTSSILSALNGGSGVAGTLTGLLYANGTSAYTVATTAQVASYLNSITFNSSGSGAVSGSAYNGASALTISYNSIGASPLAGSSSLTTAGTLSSGTWNAGIISGTYGGTGVNNGSYTLTLSGNTTANQGLTTASSPTFATITASSQFSGPGTGLTGTASSLSIGGNASTATSATYATSAGSATNATNVTGGLVNGSGYQISGSYGTSGYLLTSTGSGTVWQANSATASTYIQGYPANYSLFGADITEPNVSSGKNTGFGIGVFNASFTGTGNVGVGYLAGTGITSGAANVILGFDAGYNILAGSDQVVIGAAVPGSKNGFYDVYIGRGVTPSSTTESNTIMINGGSASVTSLADNNTYIGNSNTADTYLFGNVHVGITTTVVYRCTTAGTLPVGALTITTGNCGASTDTGLRVK